MAAALATAVYAATSSFTAGTANADPLVRPRAVRVEPEEYKIVVIASPRVEELQKELNQQAADGWRLRTAMDKMLIFAK